MKKAEGWGVIEGAVTLLVAACVMLLAAQAALTWFYVSAISKDIHLMTANQGEMMRALLAVKTQEPASNPRPNAVLDELHSELSAIRDELLKASIAADVTPPQTSGSQR